MTRRCCARDPCPEPAACYPRAPAPDAAAATVLLNRPKQTPNKHPSALLLCYYLAVKLLSKHLSIWEYEDIKTLAQLWTVQLSTPSSSCSRLLLFLQQLVPAELQTEPVTPFLIFRGTDFLYSRKQILHLQIIFRCKFNTCKLNI